MSLTRGSGPFGEEPAGTFNFEVRAPRGHVLYWEACPRRVRVVFGGETVADSRRARLLHETGRPPVYYFPEEDVRRDRMRDSAHRTRCPFKGEARYRSLTVGDRIAEDAVWLYPEPLEGAPPLAGHVAFYWDRMDRWLEEDEEVLVHPRDPYHRIDVLRASRHVRVRFAGALVAETRAPRLLFEAGLAPRAYIDPQDVRAELLVESATRTRCPYKGLASWASVRVGERTAEDAAWCYAEPLHDAESVRGWLCFDPEKVDLEVS